MKILTNVRLGLLTILMIFGVVFVGCGDIFNVDNPNSVEEENLNDPTYREALGNSAEGAVAQYYSQWVLVGGLPGDGVIAAKTRTTGIQFVDTGNFEDRHQITENAYNNMVVARWTATDVTRRLKKLVDDSTTSVKVAKSYFWDGIARTTLADMFEQITYDNGPPQKPVEVYEDAIEIFIKAAKILEASGTEESIMYEAASYASAARVYRSLYFERGGDKNAFNEADKYAKKALDVRPNFSLKMVFGPPGNLNIVYNLINEEANYGMGPKYANIKDPISGEADPRLEHSSLKGQSGLRGDDLYNQLKYPDASSNVPISRWQEAELIMAEYDVLVGDPNDAVGPINRVRSAADLPSFSSSDPGKIEDQIKYERKAEFWLELRRWQDMRYYNIIPDYWLPSNQAKGVDRRYPISKREEDVNPNL